MNKNDVQLWFSKDEKGNIVTINEVDKENKHNKYTCPLCNSEVVARQGKINSWCFAHVDKSKCDSESMIHWWFKNKLIEKGDKFIIKSDVEKEYICKEILVEQSYNVDDKIYNPDVTVITETGEIIYFEMENTNKKKIEEYLDMWIGLGNIVVEVDIKTLINSTSNELPVFKALFYKGKCFNVKKNNTYYNTIGRYKEELNNVDYTSHKEEIKKLDWFWRDVIRYKQGEVDIEYMVELIDSIGDKERLIINNILDKPRCSILKQEYHLYLEQKYVIKFDEFISEIESKYDSLIKITYSLTYSKSIFMQSKLRNNEWKSIGSSYGGSVSRYSLEDDINYINRRIDNETKDIRQTKIQNEILNNEHLIDAILLENKKLINENYSVELKWNGSTNCTIGKEYYVYLAYKYFNINILSIDITNECISRINITEDIIDFIDNNINEYRNSLKNPIANIKELTNILKEISGISYYFENEEILNILINSSYKNGCDSIRISYNEIRIWENSDYRVIQYNSKDTKLFKEILIREIENFTKDITCKCIDCKKDFVIKKGEIIFYINKGFSLPKRCKPCRMKRKLLKNGGVR